MDRLFGAAELRLGGDWGDVVRGTERAMQRGSGLEVGRDGRAAGGLLQAASKGAGAGAAAAG